MRYKIDFSYSGWNFNGYQKQPGLRTVQGELEKVLKMINNKKVIVSSAGRTDKKVNALNQVAHFDLDKKITAYKLYGALNSYLPDDIYVNKVSIVDDDFHARYMAKSKLYEYKINTNEFNPLKRTYIYQYCKSLNVCEMKKALAYFVGTHDFTTFTSKDDTRTDKVRTIKKVSLKEKDGIITISFLGTGFLKYQVRNMIGLLIKIGEEKISYDCIPKLINKKDRSLIGNTAPAEGLTLVKVNYK